MKFIELFAGIGGFRYGLEAANGTQNGGSQKTQEIGNSKGHSESEGSNAERGQPSKHSNNGGFKEQFTCVYANEFNKYAAQIYERNFNDKRYKSRGEQPQEEREHSGGNELHPKSEYTETHIVDTRDIREVPATDIPNHDLLTAGFPCQSFSIAGKRGGFEDTRGTLFFEIARIAKQKQPRLLLLENVKGLLSHDKGKTFGVILNTLDELGYDCQWQVLNSKNFGVPQNRERVFIIGHLRGQRRPEVFPFEKGDGTARIKRLGHMEGFRRYNQTYDESGIVEALDTSSGGGHQPCIPEGTKIRRLTPTECERLQGFPDNWTEGISDTQRYKCLGNAVTTNVITAIGDKLKPPAS